MYPPYASLPPRRFEALQRPFSCSPQITTRILVSLRVRGLPTALRTHTTSSHSFLFFGVFRNGIHESSTAIHLRHVSASARARTIGTQLTPFDLTFIRLPVQQALLFLPYTKPKSAMRAPNARSVPSRRPRRVCRAPRPSAQCGPTVLTSSAAVSTTPPHRAALRTRSLGLHVPSTMLGSADAAPAAANAHAPLLLMPDTCVWLAQPPLAAHANLTFAITLSLSPSPSLFTVPPAAHDCYPANDGFRAQGSIGIAGVVENNRTDSILICRAPYNGTTVYPHPTEFSPWEAFESVDPATLTTLGY
ncbi:hypothetical protein B0H14DRAFT_3530837 [Mycena olivaceomarginata]|nr:hypothetical protein B0H14DRAFT_3530837 [Mycena olivaceomarginata]